jgi:hypothetical protein
MQQQGSDTWPQEGMVGWYDPRKLGETAVDVAVSTVLGVRADYRLLEALGGDQQIFRYDEEAPPSQAQRDIWIDYVADVGDGWNPTYAVACLLARPFLEIPSAEPPGEPARLPRGRILIMGGDAVYPSASRDAYRTRLIGPYTTALEESQAPSPHLFALPGNHDWYDGLVAFTRLFCQGRWLGGWHTQQQRSYFALRLPARWWLLAVDIQLEFDIDQPQLSYFCQVAAAMQPGDRVILCTAAPDWIYGNLYDKKLENNLAFLEEKVIEKAGAKVMVTLAGDLHHYRRHESEDEVKVHKITAGGGGAFLHPTHGHNVDHLTIGPAGKQTRFTLKAEFPSRQRSRWLAFRNLGFPLLNPYFGILTGLAYLIVAWSLQTELRPVFQEIPWDWEFLDESFHATLIGLLNTPSGFAWVAIVIAGFILFTDTHSQLYRYVGGAVHALAHLTLTLVLGWGVARLTVHTLGLFPGSLWQIAASGASLWLGGYIGGSVLMGLYLLVSLNVFRRHSNEAFSSLRIQGYKNFLRLHITEDGRLTIYPIGITQVPSRWVPAPHPSPHAPKLLPGEDQALEAHLIEAPVTVFPGRRTATQQMS